MGHLLEEHLVELHALVLFELLRGHFAIIRNDLPLQEVLVAVEDQTENVDRRKQAVIDNHDGRVNNIVIAIHSARPVGNHTQNYDNDVGQVNRRRDSCRKDIFAALSHFRMLVHQDAKHTENEPVS